MAVHFSASSARVTQTMVFWSSGEWKSIQRKGSCWAEAGVASVNRIAIRPVMHPWMIRCMGLDIPEEPLSILFKAPSCSKPQLFPERVDSFLRDAVHFDHGRPRAVEPLSLPFAGGVYPHFG